LSSKLEELIESVLMDGKEDFYEVDEEIEPLKVYNRLLNDFVIYP
jgi:hypothetical protein